MRKWILAFLALCCPLMAISPHRLSLESVLDQCQWVAVVKLVEVKETGGRNGSGLQLMVVVQRSLHGNPPADKLAMTYWESWPQVDPGGRTEAPIWTGSSLERRLAGGDEFIAISSDGGLLRAEPLERELEILGLIKVHSSR